MWGFKSNSNRNLANTIFYTILNKNIAVRYNHNKQSPKGADQSFLSDHVYKHLKQISIIHDSFSCKYYENSQPWPTRRIGNCFVGSPRECNQSANNFYECPMECRPYNYRDWENC
jgi:hypothetical protein